MIDKLCDINKYIWKARDLNKCRINIICDYTYIDEISKDISDFPV